MNELTELRDTLIGVLRECCFIRWRDGKYVLFPLGNKSYAAALGVLVKHGLALWDEERKGWVILD